MGKQFRLRMIGENLPIGPYTCNFCPYLLKNVPYAGIYLVNWCKKYEACVEAYSYDKYIRLEECLKNEYPRRDDIHNEGYDKCLEYMREIEDKNAC